ncbi:hypothetical protein, partial [Edaphovirga cremea]|uniref:hypothetical protein n=1 Tax=Edaphovirga cremea TaxID=2267246 RepID=UPI003989B048
FRAKTICSSVNRDFFIGTTSVQGSVDHAGILFLNGAGFWGRVKNPSHPRLITPPPTINGEIQR